ncbi:MAG TPA: hypothetical protein VMU14_13140 [Acidimicrobiales bacterium]|nr:hypothetical protein [Acidimicrobiales bacterium]
MSVLTTWLRSRLKSTPAGEGRRRATAAVEYALVVALVATVSIVVLVRP